MARRRTDPAVDQLRAVAGVRSGTAPVGYERYGIDWSRLMPREVAVVCHFADALKEIREHEVDLLRLSGEHIRAVTAELHRQCADMRREAGRA